MELLEAAERDVPRLSATDIARVQKLEHDPERQRLWRSSRIATRIVLERAVGRAYRNIDFEIAENGRPSLGDGPPYFNVSHSGGAALIAVSNAAPIGIDLEEERGLKMTEDRRRRVIAAAARLANGQPASMSRSDADLDVLRAWVRSRGCGQVARNRYRATPDGRGGGWRQASRCWCRDCCLSARR